MADSETLVPPAAGAPVVNEKQFQMLKTAVKNDGKAFTSEKFGQLEAAVRASLLKQDSDQALILITRGALAMGSSDVHFDRLEGASDLRFRIDGNLSSVCRFSDKEYKLLLERMKFKANLKLNIDNVPQDGKFRILDGGARLDVRLSTLPTRYGEGCVCRILDSTNKIPDLEDLGFMWTSKRKIMQSLDKKSGMVIVTGPTGSGKTTTLYSTLTKLNTPDRKVVTLEDPVEYELAGVVQSEVNEKNGYTYAAGLKALLRQDPDVIMIGEIRDFDTANTAVQASLTGHLVLSTLHTKSAAETLERLLNMGVPRFNLASAVDVIIAQRLVRRVCPDCAKKYDATPQEIEILKWMMKDIGLERLAGLRDGKLTLTKGEGCEKCGFSGYKRRLGVYEVLAFTDKVRDMIRSEATVAEIVLEARKTDFMTMREDGILKAMKGMTSLPELFDVID